MHWMGSGFRAPLGRGLAEGGGENHNPTGASPVVGESRVWGQGSWWESPASGGKVRGGRTVVWGQGSWWWESRVWGEGSWWWELVVFLGVTMGLAPWGHDVSDLQHAALQAYLHA
jgi:hypothetical protein